MIAEIARLHGIGWTQTQIVEELHKSERWAEKEIVKEIVKETVKELQNK